MACVLAWIRRGKVPKFTVPLRNRRLQDGEESDVCLVSGLPRTLAIEQVLSMVGLAPSESESGQPIEVDSSELVSNCRVWCRYGDSNTALDAVYRLNGREIEGCRLQAKLEPLLDSNGRRRATQQKIHGTEIRKVGERNVAKQKRNKRKSNSGVSYSYRSIFVGNLEYPFPSGLYLTRLIALMNQLPREDPLLRILTDTTQVKYAKEMSEAMSMCDAIERAVRHFYRKAPNQIQNARLYMLGDGTSCVGAVACCLQLPSSWRYVSIDPINSLSSQDLGQYKDRIPPFKGLSQDYIIPEAPVGCEVTIVVACHSHAPLDEFWYRLSGPKIAITMACCADYSDLPGEAPALEFDDFEVYSPKRLVKIFGRR